MMNWTVFSPRRILALSVAILALSSLSACASKMHLIGPVLRRHVSIDPQDQNRPRSLPDEHQLKEEEVRQCSELLSQEEIRQEACIEKNLGEKQNHRLSRENTGV